MNRPFARTDRIIFEELAGECIIYDAVTRKAHNLNASLSWIWRACDGKTSIPEMASAFEVEFDVRNGLEIVSSGLSQLHSCHLLDSIMDDNEGSVIKSGLSRRSLVAVGGALLPIITSVAVPAAAAAKSKPEKGNGGDNGNNGKGGDNGNGKGGDH